MDKDIELIESPWIDRFTDLIKNTNESFLFTSPFIKLSTVNLLLKNRKRDIEVKGITSFKLRSFERKASDLEALKTLLKIDKVKLRNFPKLHSKIYIFDSNTAVVSSANLTQGGLRRNFELGVLLKEEPIIKELKLLVEGLMTDSKTADITEDIIKDSKSILESIPETKKELPFDYNKIEKELFGYEDSKEDSIFQSGSKPIMKGLKSWKKDVFECLTEINKEVFNLGDVYQFEEKLSYLHPENKNIQPKIRQQLQILRDMGLLEFTTGEGEYRKLWK